MPDKTVISYIQVFVPMPKPSPRQADKRSPASPRRFKILVIAFVVLATALLGLGEQYLERSLKARQIAHGSAGAAGEKAAEVPATAVAPVADDSRHDPGLPFFVERLEAHDMASEQLDQAIQRQLDSGDSSGGMTELPAKGASAEPASQEPSASPERKEVAQLELQECHRALVALLEAQSDGVADDYALQPLQQEVRQRCGRDVGLVGEQAP